MSYAVGVLGILPVSFFFVGWPGVSGGDLATIARLLAAAFMLSLPVFLAALAILVIVPRHILANLGWWCALTPVIASVSWVAVMYGFFSFVTYDATSAHFARELETILNLVYGLASFGCATLSAILFYFWNSRSPLGPGNDA